MTRRPGAFGSSCLVRVCGGGLKLQEEGDGEAVLAVAEVWSPVGYDGSWSSLVSSGGCDSSGTGEVGDVGGAVVVLEAIGEVLAGHVVGCEGSVPCLVRIAGVLGEVWRS